MAATSSSSFPSSMSTPLLVATPEPSNRVILRYDDVRTSTASHRVLHIADSSKSPMPLWKRCLCCFCLLNKEIEKIEASIDDLETNLLKAGVPISTILHE